MLTGVPESRPIDTGEFDVFVRGLDYPVFVVTTARENMRAGCLVGFTTQASIDPPRFLACLSVNNHTYSVARDAPLLVVHVLGSVQHELAELFGSKTGDEMDKFSRCRWVGGPLGVPLLEDCERRMLGRVVDQLILGDHVGFLLDPIAIQVPSLHATNSNPELTFQEARDIEAGHPA